MDFQGKYVVAFNRDRDFYELPLALAEGRYLQRLVTDLYVPDCLAGTRIPSLLGLAHRRIDGLASKLVSCSAEALFLQLFELKRARTEKEKSLVFHRLDSGLSRKAGRIAEKEGSGVFLYSGYAREAFEMLAGERHRKLLFVYHPQGDYVRSILQEDFARHPEVEFSHRRHLDEILVNEGDRVAREIELADAVACASGFTAQSIKACLGSKNTPVAVLPYGCPADASRNGIRDKRFSGKPRVLFVGQGTQRKGLHHLLAVWSERIGNTAELTLVVNNLDPGIGKMIEALPEKARVLQGLNRERLNEEFQRADIFVLPSLVEGFGLVYLEALAAGCHVIGTANTGLPDLVAPAEFATVVQAGDLTALQIALEASIAKAAGGGFDRRAIKSFAATRSWEGFRAGIRNFVQSCEIADT